MDQPHSVEATGENVEEAIAAGLEELGVGPSDVLVEVLEEASRGVFGIGAKPARVRLKLLRPPEAEPTAVSEMVEDDDEDQSGYEDTEDSGVEIDLESADDGEVARQVLTELLSKMGFETHITVSRTEPSRAGENAPWLLDVTGSSLDILIGRRGETLSSLQYITRLITSRKLQRRANIVVDIDGYKSRRSDRLEQLAIRMADEAVRQERTISLEPMPPNERRIIHLTLRNREDVHTKSTGEGDARKVTIVPNT